MVPLPDGPYTPTTLQDLASKASQLSNFKDSLAELQASHGAVLADLESTRAAAREAEAAAAEASAELTASLVASEAALDAAQMEVERLGGVLAEVQDAAVTEETRLKVGRGLGWWGDGCWRGAYTCRVRVLHVCAPWLHIHAGCV